jgi:D-3-phosphoglycerate dehydrogenase
MVTMATRFKVVLTDPHQHSFSAALLDRLDRCGASFDARKCTTEDEAIDLCRDADAVMTSAAQITSRVIAAMRTCRIIARIGTGYDNVDLRAAGDAGIPVTNVPNFCTEEVATQTLALLLACTQRVVAHDHQVRRAEWQTADMTLGRRLSRQVRGLVGFGVIGRAVATRASAFGMKILYFDPMYRPTADAPRAEAFDMLDRLLAESDIVSLHVPLQPQTRGLISSAQFRRMKPTAILLNTSRGGVVVERDLIRALTERWIAGAGLDVLDPEPPRAGHPLFAMENVVLSPHCAAHSTDALNELRSRVVDEVIRALQGQPLQHVVNQDSLKSRSIQSAEAPVAR